MFKTIFEPILSFLFPANETVRDLEAQPENLLHLLPLNTENIPGCDSVFVYQDEKVKQLVWEIKYYRNTKVADAVGKIMAERIIACTKDTERYILVPIPLTARRLKERGFNHTELLTTAILKYLPNRFSLETNALQKTRHTPKQNSIENRDERFRNIQGAFQALHPALVKDRAVIIIDDVITTGATVGEAKKVLMEANVRQVDIFTIAH